MNRRNLTSRQALEGRKKSQTAKRAREAKATGDMASSRPWLRWAWLGLAGLVLSWLGLAFVGVALLRPCPTKAHNSQGEQRTKQFFNYVAMLRFFFACPGSNHPRMIGSMVGFVIRVGFFTTTKLNTKCWPKVSNETLPATGPNQT